MPVSLYVFLPFSVSILMGLRESTAAVFGTLPAMFFFVASHFLNNDFSEVRIFKLSVRNQSIVCLESFRKGCFSELF